MKQSKSTHIQDKEIKVYECVICEKKIDTGRLCDICSGEVDEKKEIIMRKDHPFLIFRDNRIH